MRLLLAACCLAGAVGLSACATRADLRALKIEQRQLAVQHWSFAVEELDRDADIVKQMERVENLLKKIIAERKDLENVNASFCKKKRLTDLERRLFCKGVRAQ